MAIGVRRWLRGPRRPGPTMPLLSIPIAIDWVSPNPRVGEWQPAQVLSLCSPVIVSNQSRRPRLARAGFTARLRRFSRVASIFPVKPNSCSRAANSRSTISSPPAATVRGHSSAETTKKSMCSNTLIGLLNSLIIKRSLASMNNLELRNSEFGWDASCDSAGETPATVWLIDQSSDRIAVKRITSDVNRFCIPWENITGRINCPHNDKTHLHLIGFSFAIQVEVISHPDLLRKFTGRHIDAKVVSVIERIDNAIVINSGAQSSRVYVQMGNATAVHPRDGPFNKTREHLESKVIPVEGSQKEWP